MLLKILESLVLPSTVAAEASGLTLDELLFGKGEKSTGGEEMSSLNTGSGTESPA